MTDEPTDLAAARALLEDSFTRIREGVHDLCDGLDQDTATYRPDEQANPVGWLLWHLLRVQDDHVSDLAGREQAWTGGGWHERSKLTVPAQDTGYGHSADEVASVRLEPDLVDGYGEQVHRLTLDYVGSLTPAELGRVVDDSWDPRVTASVRLVSVIGDCLQHLGQAAYVAGLARRAHRS